MSPFISTFSASFVVGISLAIISSICFSVVETASSFAVITFVHKNMIARASNAPATADITISCIGFLFFVDTILIGVFVASKGKPQTGHTVASIGTSFPHSVQFFFSFAEKLKPQRMHFCDLSDIGFPQFGQAINAIIISFLITSIKILELNYQNATCNSLDSILAVTSR